MEGSALSERDLVRTNAHASSAILLLADRFSPSSHQEDLGLQFQARSGLILLKSRCRNPVSVSHARACLLGTGMP